MKFSVAEVCELFKRRFGDTGINYYHALKSLVFFEDAEEEPSPLIVFSGEEWKWENAKIFLWIASNCSRKNCFWSKNI